VTLEPTSEEQWTAWRHRALPAVELVRPGLWSIPVPLPTQGLRYVLIYAFAMDDGVALIDVGWDDDAAWTALTDGLRAIGFSAEDVAWAFPTHVHRDHYGLAARLQQAAGTRIGMHPLEAETLPSRHGPVEDQRKQILTWMAASGVPDADAPAMLPKSLGGDTVLPMPEPDLLLADGDRLPVRGWELRALWTPGHTPGHLSFAEPRLRLLLSGDHVLPHITSNISSHPRQPPNPLAQYLESLEDCASLDVAEVLPAHEYRFADLGARLAELRVHHAERLAHIRVLLRAGHGMTAWQVSEAAEWSRPWAETAPVIRRLALGETQAHLVLLQQRGQAMVRCVAGVDYWEYHSGGSGAAG
jgi:glyoxylase-like metal-dependent hydrolase (beta-lactamase superfamily II)